MVFGRKSKRPVQPSSDVGESDQLIPLTEELPAPELESIESQVESKILEKETDALEDDFKIDDQSEIIPEYRVGKVLRQGPWMHPFPLIVGVIGVALGGAIGLSVGGSTILGVLCASASYIAAPAAVGVALPKANATLALMSSIGVTFPFNLIIGIPVYFKVAEFLSTL